MTAAGAFFFYSHEPNEPAHVHADKGGGSAKIWLPPVGVASSLGLGIHWPDIDEDLSTEGLLRGAPAPRHALPT